MKSPKLLRLFANRMVITVALILLQVAWLYILFMRVLEYAGWISTALEILSILMVLYVINKTDVPAYRMGWILIILIIPLFGGLLYLLLGEKRPAASMRHQLEKGDKIHKALLEQDSRVEQNMKEMAPRAFGTTEYISRGIGFPLWDKTQIKYHPLGELQYSDMLEELEKAERYIFLEYFIIEEGEMWNAILNILVRKAAEGLDVRLIYDDMGSLTKIPIGYNKKVEKSGIKCIAFNRFIPVVSMVMNNRDHRKIMVIDGNTAFTGGINLADEYINAKVRFGHWKDTGVMVKGAAVWSFTVMFLEMWNSFRPTDKEFDCFRPTQEHLDSIESDGFIQPFSDSPLDGETVSVNVYLDILAQAKDYVYIFTPYLAVSDELHLALCNASKRGVDVRIVLPGIPDKKIAYRLTRSYYRPLMKAGVKLYEYTPGFIHAKSYVCDDELAVVGTINMDFRSLYLHFECGVLMFGSSAVAELKRDVLETFEVSRRVGPKDHSKGVILDFLGGLFDSILRVFAPLF